MQRTRLVALGAFAIASLAGAAACVDLFHSTDVLTLCDHDAEACAADTGAAPDVDVPDSTAEPATPVDLCASSSAEARGRAERACGFLGACLGTLEDDTFGTCMMRALAAYDCSFNPSLRPRGANASLWDCLAKVSSCEDLTRCVFGTPAPECRVRGGLYTACNQERDESSGLDAGSVLVECKDTTVAVGMSPCRLRGQTCVKVDDGKSICAGGRGASCRTTPRCDGTFAVQCRSAGGIDADEGINCALFGDGRCVEDDAGIACAPVAEAASCTTTANVVCGDGGATAQSCVGGKSVTMNCNALGQGCSATGASPVDPLLACKNLDAGTTCATGEDTCDAGTLVSCAQGTTFALKCTSVSGLGACTKPVGRRAACAAP